jgi:NADH dehydrogenase [ubiquinone] 1 alpha subcomplex assembly factor 7
VSAVAENLAQLIHREGPITFDRFMEIALYGEGGFFEAGHGAGRAGRDFVTSPEVGPLFGVCTARALDRLWRALDEPDPFLVVEAGAGNGRLAREVLRAEPACLPALRYVLVERSATLRAEQRDRVAMEPADEALGPFVRRTAEDEAVPARSAGPVFTTLPELPALSARAAVVLANELLDNLPFRVVELAADGWMEVRVAVDGDEFVETRIPAADELVVEAELVAAGAAHVGVRLPVPTGMPDWLHECAAVLRRGFLVVIDYAATGAELVERGERGWLRTYRDHDRGAAPLVAPGEQDITIDVPVEYLVHAAGRVGFHLVAELTQAEWLGDLGIDTLVAEAREQWDARAHVGDLEAVRHRSRVTEGAALVDPAGLGAHRVLVFRR